VDLSGIIFVMLAAVWAVYLIPKALKQHDEVARSRSVDRFSADARVVARREPVSRRDARLVVNPRPAGTRSAGGTAEPAGSSGRAEDRRTAGRVAARRRRRILTVLLLLDVATAAAAYLGHVPRWSAAVPGALTLGWLLLCRTQVRRLRARPRRVPARRPAEPAYVAAPAVEVEHSEAAVPPLRGGAAEPAGVRSTEVAADPQEEPEPVPVAEGTAAAPTAQSGALWDPVPVTLPTYVTKPRARRTVRTIDLGEAGTWTSGRIAEDAELAARATDPAAVDGRTAKPGQRAVGT
jgi:hypothetical protein